jgi:uncharacterized LabA/DUF88 family protein
MPPQTKPPNHIALLVDGDNAQPSLIEPILTEVAKHGSITTRRIYGDWTTPQMSGWKEVLQTYAIQPIQQFRYTVGKNATDSALIIDAMDLLHAGAVDGFCIVSSDSDYTRLATRMREEGLFVMGIGRMQTPNSLVNACEVFVYTENLAPSEQQPEDRPAPSPPSKWIATVGLAVETALETGIEEDGWVILSIVGSQIRKLDPAFDPRTYGYSRLSLLVKSEPDQFETSKREISGHKQLYIRRSSKRGRR